MQPQSPAMALIITSSPVPTQILAEHLRKPENTFDITTLEVGGDGITMLRPNLGIQSKGFLARTTKNLVNPARIFIATENQERIEQLRKYGFIRGNTPASVAYALVGDYLRRTLEDAARDDISLTTERKITIALETQEKLEALYAEELKIKSTDFDAQEKLRTKIIKIIEEGLTKADAEGYSFFRSGGRLGRFLLDAKAAVEDYRFPTTSFHAPNQGKFEEILDDSESKKNKKFFYDPADYGLDISSIDGALLALYAKGEPEIFKRNELPSLPISISPGEPFRHLRQRWNQLFGAILTTEDTTENLKKSLDIYTDGIPTRFFRGLAEIITSIPSIIADVATDVKNCISYEIEDFLLYKNQETMPALTHDEIPPKDSITSKESVIDSKDTRTDVLMEAAEAIIEANTAASNGASTPQENIIIPTGPSDTRYLPLAIPEINVLMHSTLLARLGRSGEGFILGSQRYALNHPIATAVITISTGSLFFALPLTDQLLLVLSKANLGFINTAITSTPWANEAEHLAKAFEHAIQSSHMRGAITFFCGSFLAYTAGQSASLVDFRHLLANITSNPVSVQAALVASILTAAESIRIIGLSGHANPKITLARQQLALMVSSARLSNPNTSLIGELLSFPIRLIATPIRLLASLLSLNRASIAHELRHFKEVCMNGLHIGLDFSVALTRFATRAAFFIPKYAFKLGTAVLLRTTGTVGDIAIWIGSVFCIPYTRTSSLEKAENPLRSVATKMLGIPLALVGIPFGALGKGAIFLSQKGFAIKNALENGAYRNIEAPLLRMFNQAFNALSATFNPLHPAYIKKMLDDLERKTLKEKGIELKTFTNELDATSTSQATLGHLLNEQTTEPKPTSTEPTASPTLLISGSDSSKTTEYSIDADQDPTTNRLPRPGSSFSSSSESSV